MARSPSEINLAANLANERVTNDTLVLNTSL